MPESNKEKKTQLRAKVQDLVSRYEQEKQHNKELQMELEQLKSEQQGRLQESPQQQNPLLPSEVVQQHMRDLRHTGNPQHQPAPQPYGALPYGQQYRNAFSIPPSQQSYYEQPSPAGADTLMITIGQTQQAITQVSMQIQQAHSQSGNAYGAYPQQFSSLVQNAVYLLSLLDNLYNQLSELNRELAMYSPSLL